MRPVHKSTASTSYTYDPNRQVKPTASQNRQTLLANLQLIPGLIAGTSPTFGEMLEAWTRRVDDPHSSLSTLLTDQDVKTIVGIITPEYKKAALPLVQELGSYCSYCETYIPGLLEVEHVCPKSEFPLFALDWSNFLLACGPCNTSKSNEPNRKSISTNAKSIGWNHQLEDQSKIKVENDYVWPHTNPFSFQEYKPVLYYCNGNRNSGSWKTVDSIQTGLSTNADPSSGLTLISQNFTTLEVVADIPNIGHRSVEARLDPQNVASVSGKGLIDILKLNTLGTTVYDRRVMNRTTAWFAALSAVEAWQIQEQAFDPNPPPSSIFDAWLQNTVQSAANKGFFSVWIEVLNRNRRIKNAPMNRKGQAMTLAEEFLHSAAFPTAFPNTDLTQIP